MALETCSSFDFFPSLSRTMESLVIYGVSSYFTCFSRTIVCLAIFGTCSLFTCFSSCSFLFQILVYLISVSFFIDGIVTLLQFQAI
jgi:hypothetical protein